MIREVYSCLCSINQEVRFSVTSERESLKKAAAKKQERKGRTVTRGLQNDEDSMFMERSQEKTQTEYEEIVYERREEKVVHQEEKPKKLTKRQEIINDRSKLFVGKAFIDGELIESLRSSSQQLKPSGQEEMRKSRVTEQPLERKFGTEFILSPKRVSATHYKSFGNARGKGNSFLVGKVFTDNV